MLKNKVVLLLTALTLFLTACAQEEQPTYVSTPNYKMEEPSPRTWINYDGEKYNFFKVYSKTEESNIQMDHLIDTGEVTGKDDGIESNLQIYQDKNTKKLFVSSSYNDQKEWAEFKK